jgi:hypothetical protein
MIPEIIRSIRRPLLNDAMRLTAERVVGLSNVYAIPIGSEVRSIRRLDRESRVEKPIC